MTSERPRDLRSELASLQIDRGAARAEPAPRRPLSPRALGAMVAGLALLGCPLIPLLGGLPVAGVGRRLLAARQHVVLAHLVAHGQLSQTMRAGEEPH